MSWLYELLRELSGEAALQRRMARLLAQEGCCGAITPAEAARRAMAEAAERRGRCC